MNIVTDVEASQSLLHYSFFKNPISLLPQYTHKQTLSTPKSPSLAYEFFLSSHLLGWAHPLGILPCESLSGMPSLPLLGPGSKISVSLSDLSVVLVYVLNRQITQNKLFLSGRITPYNTCACGLPNQTASITCGIRTFQINPPNWVKKEAVVFWWCNNGFCVA